MSKKRQLAAVGDRDSVILFKALGFETEFAESEEEVTKVVRKLIKEEVAVIFITEEAAQLIPNIIEHYKPEPFPAIIPIANKNGSIGIGMQGIKENVEKAIGVDILNN